ncbi:MAG: hypothetical protein HC817_15660 [Saprospiraceae bacterium]|nr:hypothetical protein [Saprospiraceae bacterium]
MLNCDRPPMNRNDCETLNARGGIDGLNEFCENQEIVYLNSTPQTADSTIYCWGDGSFSIEKGTGNGKHTYSFPRDTCLRTNNGIIELEITMIVFKRCAAGYSVNRIGTPISIRLRPKIELAIPNPICENTSFTVRNTSCGNDIDARITCQYTFGTQTSSSCGSSVTFQFPQSGSVPLEYTMSNRCGSRVFKQDIAVIGLPKVKAEILSGVQVINGENLVCLSGGGSVQLQGKNSQNSTRFRWTVSPTTGTNWSPRQDTCCPILRFSAAGTYTVTLEVDNQCQKPSRETLTFKVLSAQSLSLQSQNDACLPFNYRFTPIAGATYERLFNGTTVGNFDPNAGFNADFGQHIIIAKLNNECGNQERRDTFIVEAAREVSFLLPTADTTVCQSNIPIAFLTNLTDGRFTISPNTALPKRGDTTFFTPSVSGTFILIFRRGTGVCEKRQRAA